MSNQSMTKHEDEYENTGAQICRFDATMKILQMYKLAIFWLTDLQASEFFVKTSLLVTRGHSYKLYKKHSSSTVRAKFFSERIVSVLNNLPDIVDFSTLTSFIRTIKTVDLSEHLSYCLQLLVLLCFTVFIFVSFLGADVVPCFIH